MTSIRELIRLQSIDSEIAARRVILDDIKRELADTAALEKLREQAAGVMERLHEAERAQQDADYEVEALSSQIATEEGKLYGGTVRNPKELTSLDQEVSSLKARRTVLEERAIAALAVVDALRQELAGIQLGLDTAQEERRALEAKLGAQISQINAELNLFNTQRSGIAVQVPAEDLDTYGRLLVMKQGRAVARMERAVCQGCRINLPLTIQQRVRANQQLVQCPSCRRILFADQ